MNNNVGIIPFKLFGLQRTGTNLMRFLMLRHFNVHSAEIGLEWKHGRVADSDRSWNDKQMKFILCVKNPYAWLHSCFRYFQVRWQDDDTVAPQFRQNPGISFADFVATPSYEFDSPVHRWNEMYRHWLTELPDNRTVVVRQEDQLHRQNCVLADVARLLDLQWKEDSHFCPMKAHVDADMALGPPINDLYYLRHEYLQHFTDDLLASIDRVLDWNLMRIFAYERHDQLTRMETAVHHDEQRLESQQLNSHSDSSHGIANLVELDDDPQLIKPVTGIGPTEFHIAVRNSGDPATDTGITVGKWLYHRVGYDSRLMTFLPDGSIGEGAAICEMFWKVRSVGGGRIALDIRSRSSLTCRLIWHADRIWRGHWEQFERMPIELIPQEE